MASIEEVDLVSEETETASRSKNVAKRGRGRKRGATSVSTRATRSKKALSNNPQGDEDEEEVEDTSQNDSRDSQDNDLSVECDVSNDSKNISVESDVIKNGIVETLASESEKMETSLEAKNSKNNVKGEVERKATDESNDESEHEASVTNERSDDNVSETENTSVQKIDSASGETAVVESEKVRNEEPAVAVEVDATEVSNEEEIVNKVTATEDIEATLKASENKLESAKDISAVVEDDISVIVEDQTTSKEDVTTPEVVSLKDDSGSTNDTSSIEIVTISEDVASDAKDVIVIADEKANISTSEVINIDDDDEENIVTESTTVEVKVSSDVPTSEVVKASPDVPTSEPVNVGKQVDSKVDNGEKQNDEGIKNDSMVSEGPAAAISSGIVGHTKPPDTSSIGSPMEEDISQYTVLEETNASQGSADEKVDDAMEVEESSVADKKEREQSPEAGEMKNASMDDMTVIDEVEDEGEEKDEGSKESKTVVKSHVQLDDTEMVSEDELPTETAKEPETEAVSDEELPEPTTSGDLPETEEVSEDELPPEKTEKKKKDSDEVATPVESESVSEPIKKKKKGRFESQKRKLAEGDTYDPSSPTSENSCDETPSAKRAALSSGSADSKAKQLVKGRKTLPELEKYWKAVKEDASDFTGWTYLLQYVDQENDIDAAREAYDAFLSHYPYCYGYWRKYADYEKRKGNKEKCEEVFDRGLKAIPLSVDLWIHYLNYCKTTYSDDEEFLRTQFERALTACGMEFRSDRLWESFIKWETEGKRLQNVTAIYDRLLNMPTQGYTSHFENFQEHISGNPPQKVLSVDEFLSLRREVLQLLKQYDSPGAEEAAPGEEAEAPPGEEPEETPSVSDEETTALRERIVSLRRKVHKATVAAVADRWNFEEGIKRPYFHVKPLERCQLKNWKEYLDFEIEKGDRERIIILFERCLIACALYEEFWLKFVRYLESEKNEDMIDKIRDVYERACTIHHPKKPNLHLHWSVFEESHKNYDKAAEILTNLEKAVPSLIQVSYRRINLERRRGNLDKVCSLYEHYISNSKNKVIANNMAIKYARFCWKVKSDVEKAISILNKAMEKDKENPRLYLQLIDMGLQRQILDEAEIISTIDLFLSRDVDPEQKVLFAQRKVEFLEDFSADIASVQKSHDEFLRYCKQIKERKKKSAEDAKSESLSKKSKSGSGDSASSQHASHTGAQQSHTPGQNPQPASQGTASQYATQGYNQSNYSQAPPTQGNYQGGQYATGSQPAGPYSQAPYNQQYSQSGDASYANYQNWGYSQPGYGGYNQGWGNYNYY